MFNMHRTYRLTFLDRLKAEGNELERPSAGFTLRRGG